MTFTVTTNPLGHSRIDEITRRRTRSTKTTGLLGAMHDRAYISAYRAKVLDLEADVSRIHSFVSRNQAQADSTRKQRALKHLRISQSSCFLARLIRAVREKLAVGRSPETRLSPTVSAG
jgi:hypothetical protein